MKKTLCPRCGFTISDNSRFCPHCGTPLTSPKKKSPLIPILWTLSGVVLVLIITVAIILLVNKKAAPNHSADSSLSSIPNPEDFETAEEYYDAVTQIVSVIDVRESKTINVMANFTRDMEKRGFALGEMLVPYTLDGELTSDDISSIDPFEGHPIYQMTYSPDGEFFWVINEINGQLMASPLSYIFENNLTRDIVLSEKETLMSYSSHSGSFFEMIPNEEVCLVIVVDEINAQVLDEFTPEVLDTYVK